MDAKRGVSMSGTDGGVPRRTLIVDDERARVQLTAFTATGASAPDRVLVFMPAMGASGQSYSVFATQIAERGYDIVIASLRNAVPSERGHDFGYQELLEIDCKAAVACVRSQFPGRTVVLGGHSLGGQLALLYAARHPGEVDGVVLVAACSVYYRSWAMPERLRVFAGTQFCWLVSECLGYFPGRRFGFAGEREARGVMRDWARQARTGAYRIRGGANDDEALLGECAIPVLASSFDDDVLAPGPAVDHLCGKLRAADLTRIRFPGSAPGKGRIHFRWLRAPEMVVDTVAEWLARHGQRGTNPRTVESAGTKDGKVE